MNNETWKCHFCDLILDKNGLYLVGFGEKGSGQPLKTVCRECHQAWEFLNKINI